MARRGYRSSYDRDMYLNHLQIAHGVGLTEDRDPDSLKKRGEGEVLRT
jgi:hypothetical protein